MDISIVIPLLNEEESLPELVKWIETVMKQHNYSYDVWMVDDGSTDNSWQVINDLRRDYPFIRAIKFMTNYGKSAALNSAFAKVEGDVVITMDADLQDSPEEIPELYRMVMEDGFDLVSGWKKKRYDPKLTKNIPSKLYNWAARRISKLKLHDFNCGLKAYQNRVIKNIEVYGEMHRYIPVIAKWEGFTKIGEKVVQHQARKYGETKFGMERFINGLLDLFSISFIGKFGKRPMHFFGAIGTLFIFLAIAILGWLTIGKFFLGMHDMDERPLFFFGITLLIVGVQLFIAGFLAELITRNSAERNSYKIEETL